MCALSGNNVAAVQHRERERERERQTSNMRFVGCVCVSVFVYFQLVVLALLWSTTVKVVFMLRYMRKTSRKML